MKKKMLTMAFAVRIFVAVFLVVAVAWQAEAVITGPTNITIKHTCISMPDGAVSAPTATGCPANTIKMWLPSNNDAVLPDTGLLAPGSFVISADEGDSLTINLSNELAIPVSLVISGQVLTPNNGPVWFTDIADPYTSMTFSGIRPPGNVTSRVRSFSHEAPAGAPGAPGAATAYTWPSLKPGTYLILSGTHPSLQVQMGIYGVLIVRAAGGGPYAGITAPAQEVTLLFSEIDPAIHNSADDAAMVATTPTIPSTNVFYPKYFLINGKAFPGNNPIPIGAAGSTTLLRFANAGLDTYVPLLQGQNMLVIAEDGYLKPVELRPVDGSLNRYSVDLHAGKTFDALLTNPAAGYIPLYDRRLYLSNAAQAPGGMLTYLEVPDGAPQTLTVSTTGGTGTGKVAAESVPGGIFCDSSIIPPATGATDCTQAYNTGTQLKLVGYPNPGSLLNGWGVTCDFVTASNECIVTMNEAKNVVANFKAFAAVQLITPNGGGSIPAGSLYPVTWGAPANAVKFRLRYSIDGGNTWILINNNITGNSYNWLVPTIRGQKNAKVQVTGYNANNVAVGSDASNTPFSINIVTVTSPAAGSSWSSGVGQAFVPVTWVTNGAAGIVKTIVIQYSKNNGTTWLPVETLDNAGGQYDTGGTVNWQIEPTVNGNKPNSFVRVTLKDAAGNVFARDKSGKFTITP
jgi:FtsP/CotA-like multicopper oxidase with cupredoxin domain